MWFRASRGAMTGTSEFNSSLKVTRGARGAFIVEGGSKSMTWHCIRGQETEGEALQSCLKRRKFRTYYIYTHILYIYELSTYNIVIIYANISVFLSFLQLCLVVLLLKSPLLAAGDPPATGPFAAWQRWLSNLGWT